MDSIKSQLVLFRQNPFRFNRYLAISRPSPSDALKNSPLRIVPNDVMQMIAKHFTPASAGSFFLTCRQIGLVIGTQYIDGLKTSKDDTLEFLNLLEHDLQDQIACTFCRKLHKMRNAERYAKKSYCWEGYSTDPEISGLPEFDTIPSCVKDDELRRVGLYAHKNFGVTISKMAIKHYRLFGNDAQTRRLLRLLSAPENYSDDRSCKSLRTEKKGECRMKNGSIFTRKLMKYNWKCQSLEIPSHIPICSHLHLAKVGSKLCARLYCAYSRPEEIWSALQLPCQKYTATNENNISRDIHSGLLQCRYCLTVFKVELKHHNRYPISRCTTALAIVVYKQFESEADWKTHLPLYGSDDGESVPIEFSKEKISSVFEVDDTGFGPTFTSWSEFYLAWQKVFLDELELACLAVILSLLYWHRT
ncbi:hypothetical protein BELL_0470g00010 [Botrytis elliptica]|uniref:Uncharacterized protein n=1 Tax=Botrytis elliptica TaxID=278938 RepID=A0A4Z1JG68_9HELO|nr:hypothetical protein EAE99_007051 [Botrytis elliptica]TGO72294.1 hypothetical protein BELL_0470g00010 [Botrytis elliptica]